MDEPIIEIKYDINAGQYVISITQEGESTVENPIHLHFNKEATIADLLFIHKALDGICFMQYPFEDIYDLDDPPDKPLVTVRVNKYTGGKYINIVPSECSNLLNEEIDLYFNDLTDITHVFNVLKELELVGEYIYEGVE